MALEVRWGRPEVLLSVHWSLLGVSWGVVGVSWVAFASPGGSLGGLGVARGSLGLSWGRFWGVRAAKRYQHDAKMDMQSPTALKKP